MTPQVGGNGSGAAAPVRRPGWGERLAAAGLTGGALAAAFPAVHAGFLAWVALVPLLRTIRRLSVGQAFVTGWLAGLVFFVCGTYWVVHTIDHYTRLPLAVAVGVLLLMCGALACYVGAFAAGVRWLERRGVGVLWIVAPALWVTLEWLRGWFFIGFPWNALGYSQHRFSALVQMAEVTGVYGVSAVVVLFNVVVADLIGSRGRAVRRHLPALVAATTLLVLLPVLGRWRAQALAVRPPAGTVRVGIAQGNVEQDRKWDPAFQDETMRRYTELTEAAAAAGAELVVWPETATPFFFQERTPWRAHVLELADDLSVALLFGSPAYERLGPDTFQQVNRAYLVGPDGMERDWYDKIELVPFGEYVPYASVLFFVDQMVESVGGIAPGRRATVFDGPSGRFGALICYEGIFPALSRRLVAEGADYLVNVTNDAWYGATSAPHQHLVQATFRAIENRVPMVRAANTGISAIVAPDGRIAWSGSLDQLLWHVSDVAYGDVRTFYTRFGDVFVWLCVLVMLAAIGRGLLRRPG